MRRREKEKMQVLEGEKMSHLTFSLPLAPNPLLLIPYPGVEYHDSSELR